MVTAKYEQSSQSEQASNEADGAWFVGVPNGKPIGEKTDFPVTDNTNDPHILMRAILNAGVNYDLLTK